MLRHTRIRGTIGLASSKVSNNGGAAFNLSVAARTDQIAKIWEEARRIPCVHKGKIGVKREQ